MNKLAELVAHDKALHFLAGTVIACLGALHSPLLSLAVTVWAAFGREAYNRAAGGRFDLRDIAWTVAPVALVNAPYYL